MIRRPPRSTLDRSSAASDVYKRQVPTGSKPSCFRRMKESTARSALVYLWKSSCLCLARPGQSKNQLRRAAAADVHHRRVAVTKTLAAAGDNQPNRLESVSVL